MTAPELLVASLVVGAGATVQGAVGFGLNLVAAPVLAMLDPRLVPGPAIVIAIVLTVLMAVRDRAHVEWAGLRWALVGRLPGTAIGAVAVALMSPASLEVAIAVAVLAAVAVTGLHPHLRPTTGVLLGAGVVSGVMATASSIGGPPMAMVYQRSPGATVRGTLAGFFAVGGVLSLAMLAAVGEFGTTELRASLVLLPGLVAGFVASRHVSSRLDAGHTRTAVLLVSATSALALLARHLV